MPTHRAHLYRSIPAAKFHPDAVEPDGTGTAGTDGHGSDSSSTDATAKGAKHASGAAKRWAFLHSPDFWVWAVIITISVVAALMSMDGTMRGWSWAGLDPTNPLRFGMPFIAEFSFLMWLLIAEVSIRAERSPYLWWLVAAVTAGVVVTLNTAFGAGRAHPYREAAIFGVASAVSLAGAFAKFYLRYVASEVRKGLREGAKPKLLLNPRFFEQPKIRWRAHLIAGRIGSKTVVGDNGKPKRVPLTVDEAVALADLWREVYQDYRAKQDDGKKGERQLAKRTAWNAVKTECGVKVYKPNKLKVGRVEFIQPEREPEREPAPIRTAEEALEKFERELADKPAGPKPPRIEPTNRERSIDPVAPAPTGAGEAAKPEWFSQHAKHINLVQSAVPDWKTRELPVDEVQDLGEKFPRQGLANRGNATRIAACLRTLRAEAHQASN